MLGPQTIEQYEQSHHTPAQDDITLYCTGHAVSHGTDHTKDEALYITTNDHTPCKNTLLQGALWSA